MSLQYLLRKGSCVVGIVRQQLIKTLIFSLQEINYVYNVAFYVCFEKIGTTHFYKKTRRITFTLQSGNLLIKPSKEQKCLFVNGY